MFNRQPSKLPAQRDPIVISTLIEHSVTRFSNYSLEVWQSSTKSFILRIIIFFTSSIPVSNSWFSLFLRRAYRKSKSKFLPIKVGIVLQTQKFFVVDPFSYACFCLFPLRVAWQRLPASCKVKKASQNSCFSISRKVFNKLAHCSHEVFKGRKRSSRPHGSRTERVSLYNITKSYNKLSVSKLIDGWNG